MEANETINSTVRKSDEMHVYFADFIRGNMEIYRTLKDTIFLHIEYTTTSEYVESRRRV